MKNVIEVVRFKVREGVTTSDLMTGANAAQLAISQFAGVEYRSLSYDNETQTWSDIIYWDSIESATRGCEQFKQDEACMAFVALMIPETVHIAHESIKLSFLAQKYQS